MAESSNPKTGTKSGMMTSPISGSTIPTGNHPKNTGGKKGRSGRKPEIFREIMREAASNGTTIHALRAILKDKDHPAFMKALEYATERGYGKELQQIAGDLNLVHGVLKVPPTADPARWAVDSDTPGDVAENLEAIKHLTEGDPNGNGR